MAKEHQRSNREAKKPKKVTKPSAEAPTAFAKGQTTSIGKPPGTGKPKKGS